MIQPKKELLILFFLDSSSIKFIETTANHSKIDNKFKDDITKCLENIKNSHPPMQVKEIIFCYSTNDLLPETFNELNILCNAHNITLSVYNADKLTNILIENKANRIIKEYLNIAYNTEQIKILKEFIDSNKPIPLLENTLYREKESQELTILFEQNDLIILSGQSGIGKTQFACTFARDYSINNDLHLFCFRSNKAPILDEILELDVNNSYFFLIDDANEFPNLESIIDIIFARSSNSKILLTIRNYAINNIKINHTINYNKYELRPLSNIEILNILEQQSPKFQINSQNELIKLINGNIRLGFFIAKSFLNSNNSPITFKNISDIFHQYYNSFIQEIIVPSQENKLLLSVLSIFKYINLNDTNFIKLIENNHKINLYNYKSTLNNLVQKEILTSYNGIYKFTDQNIQNLILYSIYCEDKNLFIYKTLNQYFEKYSNEISECIFIIITIFNNQQDKENISLQLIMYWNEIKKQNDIKKMWLFILKFHCIVEITSLNFIYQQIKQNILDREQFYIINNILTDLTKFSNYQLALELYFEIILNYSEYHDLFHEYYNTNYYIGDNTSDPEKRILPIFINTLEKKIQESHNNEMLVDILFQCCEDIATPILLHCYYGNEQDKEDRKIMWNSLLKFGQYNPNKLYSILMAIPYYDDINNEFKSLDAPFIAKILKKYFSEPNLSNIILFQYLFKNLNHYLTTEISLSIYNNDIYNFYKKNEKFRKIYEEYLFKNTSLPLFYNKMSFEELQKIINYYYELSTEHYNIFTQQLYAIDYLLTKLKIDNILYKNLIYYFLKHPLSTIIKNDFTYINIITKLHSFIDYSEIYLIISPFFQANSYLFFSYWYIIPLDKISQHDIEEIQNYIQYHLSENESSLFLQLDFINKFSQIDKNFCLNILQKTNKTPTMSRNIASTIHFLFENIINPNSTYHFILQNHCELICELFIKAIKTNINLDYHNIFKQLIEINPLFLDNYLSVITDKEYYNSHQSNDKRNSLLSSVTNYCTYLTKVFDYLSSLPITIKYYTIGASFIRSSNNMDNIYNFIKEYVKNNSHDLSKMIFLSHCLIKTFEDLQINFFTLFTSYNASYEDFIQLKLLPDYYSGHGSLIPSIKNRQRFLEKIQNNIPNTLKFISHKNHIQTQIYNIQSEIQWEMQNEFLR